MKKIKLLSTCFAATLFALSLSSNANAMICPFTDYFAIDIPTNGKILNYPYVLGNLRFEKQTDTFFQLSCNNNSDTSSGDLYIDVGINQYNMCTLTVHDGPYVNNPEVTNVICTGNLNFNGIDHVWGSKSYKLKFS